MRWQGLIFGIGGISFIVLSFIVLLVDDKTFLYILRALSSVELAIVSILMLIISWKLITLRPAPPAA
ncbi:MAG: hypothetical protein BA066_05700 [Candidatus Korarchaeota archaeon NZ13-K]|nr:MAG: hypothetical protein BA066_05700 [Candidatus Korarchaeota archaeon NZ13-K]